MKKIKGENLKLHDIVWRGHKDFVRITNVGPRPDSGAYQYINYKCKQIFRKHKIGSSIIGIVVATNENVEILEQNEIDLLSMNR
jgi:nicotinic acid phosphoribosyltransferase